MLESLFDKVTGLRLTTLLKVTFLHWCFSRFLTFTNDKLCSLIWFSNKTEAIQLKKQK